MLKRLIGSAELAELASRNASLAGRLRPDDLPRLAALTAGDGSGPSLALDAVAEFQNGPEGFPVVRVRVARSWALVCQRCLSATACEIDIASELTILPGEREAARVADPFDCLIPDAEGLRLLEVIEDEVLAALPMAPVHQPGHACTAVGSASSALESIEKKTNRPFAGLAELMDGSTTDSTA